MQRHDALGVVRGGRYHRCAGCENGGQPKRRTGNVPGSTGRTWNAAAALNATGGTGGIIIDNTATGGGSQVYYSTRTSPGIAVQASQAGLN